MSLKRILIEATKALVALEGNNGDRMKMNGTDLGLITILTINMVATSDDSKCNKIITLVLLAVCLLIHFLDWLIDFLEKIDKKIEGQNGN